MPRIIEIVLFLAPFAAFVVWRACFRSVLVPLWVLASLGGLVLAMLVLLIWDHLQDAGDATQAYVPATLQSGRIVQGHPGAPP